MYFVNRDGSNNVWSVTYTHRMASSCLTSQLLCTLWKNKWIFW